MQGKITHASGGAAAVGDVTFSIDFELRDSDAHVIAGPGTVWTATLDTEGAFSQSLPVNDDDDLSPTGWGYTVRVNTDAWSDVGSIAVPTGATALAFDTAYVSGRATPPGGGVLVPADGTDGYVLSWDADAVAPVWVATEQAAGGVPTSRTITAGTGLTGGGTLAADRTLGLASIADGSVLANTSGAAAAPVATDIDSTFKTALALVKGDVGLGNVDNTADASKPVSTAQATADALRPTVELAGVAVSGAVISIGSTEPTSPTNGDVWFDTSS